MSIAARESLARFRGKLAVFLQALSHPFRSCRVKIRYHLSVVKLKLDTGNADRAQEGNCDRMVRFLSEWRERKGAEAIFYEKGMFALVRIHSLEADGHSMDFYCDCIPCPGLPVLTFWGRPEGSFHIGSSWGYVSARHDYWEVSPYVSWILIFDPEAIQTFKAVAVKFQNESELDRGKQLQECLRAWNQSRFATERSLAKNLHITQ